MKIDKVDRLVRETMAEVIAEGANITWQAATANALRTTRSTYTRERRRPELRVYFIGRRFGSIFAKPVPLFTSII